ncbi:response regulator transcription factor [Hufsiella ginkgonis]|uniref:Response regulator n=1 Tax=Hufsiella ginkgonis TaxID=2695274 RepID=A0A7K1Y087_9SPHI|nr:response regulator transcription factor [Hufsiella ginkgonis]MXV16684.1 response regulator [Hufsiella ginkgonis]
MIKVLLAEDHYIVRNGIKSLLEKEKEISVIGEADDGIDAITQLDKGLRPDIIIADINMPKMDGLLLTETLKKRYPDIRVIILSMMDHDKYLVDSFKAGAQGYVLKNAHLSELIFAVRFVFLGKFYICSEISMRMFRHVSSESAKLSYSNLASVEFSERELEVLEMTADGLTNQQIATRIFSSKRTIEGLRQSMINKTGVKNTAALIQYAFRAGLVK